MKAAVVCLLCVFVATISVVSSYDQSRSFGTVLPGDRLLDREALFLVGRNPMILAVSYVYPKEERGEIISSIKLIDRWLNGTNGDLFIFSGGVNRTSVSASVRSLKGYGVSYDIEVWGRY